MRCVILLLALAACRDEQLARLQAIRDEVCACKTASCGEIALDKVGKDKISSNRQTQRLAREMMGCLARLYEQGRPTTDPDAPRDETTSDPETSVPASAGTP